jgi:site-specific DNA-cytosine methylase
LRKFVPRFGSQFIDGYKTRLDAIHKLESPLPTLDTKCNKGLVTVQFLDLYYGNGAPQSVDNPCPSVTTVNSFALASVVSGHSSGDIAQTDSDTMRQIKEFMQLNGIRDICMRMLTVEELARAQGFPERFRFPANGTITKHIIGNSVVPGTMCEIILALCAANPQLF